MIGDHACLAVLFCLLAPTTFPLTCDYGSGDLSFSPLHAGDVLDVVGVTETRQSKVVARRVVVVDEPVLTFNGNHILAINIRTSLIQNLNITGYSRYKVVFSIPLDDTPSSNSASARDAKTDPAGAH